MSQENVKVVREVVEAAARHDIERLIELTDPEVEWQSYLAQLAEGGVYRGHKGMREYVRDINEALDIFELAIEQVIAVGDVVLCVGQLRYRGRTSGVETSSLAGYMVKFRDGKVVRMRAIRDPERAFEAAGLSE